MSAATIKLTQLELTNFRNIEHSVYRFSDRCGISGPNYTGKTNLLNAICYLLTDSMIDNSSDIVSIKPKGAERVSVIVKAWLDIDGEEVVVAKEYREVWNKDKTALTGHETVYYIGPSGSEAIKYNTIKSAKQEIYRLFKMNEADLARIPSKIDPVKMLVISNYLNAYVDTKTYRELLINVIGQVTNEEIYASNPNIKPVIDAKLASYRYDTAMCKKALCQSKESLDDQIKVCEDLIKDFQQHSDVDESALTDAMKELEACSQAKYDLRNSSVNKKGDSRIPSLRSELAGKSEKLTELTKVSVDSVTRFNDELQSKIAEIDLKLSDGSKELIAVNQSKYAVQGQIEALEREIRLNESNAQQCSRIRENLLDEIKRERGKRFDDSRFEKIICPNCQTLVNEEAIRIAREQFEKRTADRIEEIRAKGVANNLDRDLYLKKNEEIREQMIPLRKQLTELEEKEGALLDAVNKWKLNKKQLQGQMKTYQESEEILLLRRDIASVKATISAYETRAEQEFTRSVEEQMNEIRSREGKANVVVQEHNNYLFYQKEVEKKREEVKSLVRERSTIEEMIAALDLYLKFKLHLLTDKLNAYFPGITFTLVESNIKEGSWNEVCYPMVVTNRRVRYGNGSTSEKVMTDLAVRNAFKKILNLPNLPFLFDEGEALDQKTIKGLQTDAQLITALVDNVHQRPTMIDLEDRMEVV